MPRTEDPTKRNTQVAQRSGEGIKADHNHKTATKLAATQAIGKKGSTIQQVLSGSLSSAQLLTRHQAGMLQQAQFHLACLVLQGGGAAAASNDALTRSIRWARCMRLTVLNVFGVLGSGGEATTAELGDAELGNAAWIVVKVKGDGIASNLQWCW